MTFDYGSAVLRSLTRQLALSEPLTDEQVHDAVERLVDEAVSAEEKADFLQQLSLKKETPAEIAAFVRELRALAVVPQISPELRKREILDVVGTGGDRLSTFNISTTVAIIASAAGVQVAKHGNRASTSPIGSADVMQALGIPFDVGPEEAVRSLSLHGFAFFFAPRYHPCFRQIIPARKLCAARGYSTIFNFLGPLLNPAMPSAMLIGVPRPELCEPLARVLQSVGVSRALVVSGCVPQPDGPRYLDEISSLGQTTVAEFYHEKGMTCGELSPDLFPLQPATLEDLKGGADGAYNAEIIRAILRGDDRGPKRDVVLLNAAGALFVAGQTRTMAEGWDVAAETIDSGAAWTKFQQLARP